MGKPVGIGHAPRPYVLPAADPRGIHPDRWFLADHFVATDGSSPSNRSGDDGRAQDLTRRARAAMTCDPGEGTRLHLLASELRREGCRVELAAENYDALTRHFLDAGEMRTAVAYMRKLLVAVERSSDLAANVAHLFLAAEVYARLGRKAAATALIARGCAVAAHPSSVRRGAELLRTVAAMPDETEEACCGCGSGVLFATCCGIGDHDPVEHKVIPLGPGGKHEAGNGSVWWSPGTHGIDLALLAGGGAARNWASWRVDEGRYSLVAFPNWSGRALLAARQTRDMSHADPGGTSGPSSTILQAACACEAFINAVAFFVGKSDPGRWNGLDLPAKLLGSARKYQQTVPVHLRWRQIGTGLLGAGWADAARLDELRLLTKIRSTLVHFHGYDNEEVIAPLGGPLPSWVEKLPASVLLRDPPNTWIDRLLTPSLSDWAVELAEELIASFRREWAAQAERFDLELHSEAMADEELKHSVELDEVPARCLELDRLYAPASAIGHIASRLTAEKEG